MRNKIKCSLIELDLSAREVVGRTYCIHTRGSSLEELTYKPAFTYPRTNRLALFSLAQETANAVCTARVCTCARNVDKVRDLRCAYVRWRVIRSSLL